MVKALKICRLIERNNLTLSIIERELGYSNSGLRKAIADNSRVNATRIERLLEIFPGLSREWLESDRDDNTPLVKFVPKYTVANDPEHGKSKSKEGTGQVGVNEQNPPQGQVSKDLIDDLKDQIIAAEREAKETYKRNAELERELRMKEATEYVSREIFEAHQAGRIAVQQFVFAKLAQALKVPENDLDVELYRTMEEKVGVKRKSNLAESHKMGR